MGYELVIALAAVGLALTALLQVRQHVHLTKNTTERLKAEQSGLTEELSGRLKRIGERFGHQLDGSDSTELRRIASALRVLEMRLQEHDTLLCSLITEDEARHLWNITQGDTTLYQLHRGVEHELRSLVRRGLLSKQGDFKIHELPHEFELRDHFALTESGEMLLTLRQHLKTTDTRAKDSLPPAAPESSKRTTPPSFIRPKAV